jgi:small subunit ribosomal protein S20
MANHKSAKKRIKQTIVKNDRNSFYRTRIKNVTKKLKESIEAGNKEEAEVNFKSANKFLHKCVSKNILKKNTASRKISRLHKLVNSL